MWLKIIRINQKFIGLNLVPALAVVVVVGLEAGAHHVRKVAVPLVSHCGEEREREREREREVQCRPDIWSNRLYGQYAFVVPIRKLKQFFRVAIKLIFLGAICVFIQPQHPLLVYICLFNTGQKCQLHCICISCMRINKFWFMQSKVCLLGPLIMKLIGCMINQTSYFLVNC